MRLVRPFALRGAGVLTPPLAERVLGLLRDLSATLRKREGF